MHSLRIQLFPCPALKAECTCGTNIKKAHNKLQYTQEFTEIQFVAKVREQKLAIKKIKYSFKSKNMSIQKY